MINILNYNYPKILNLNFIQYPLTLKMFSWFAWLVYLLLFPKLIEMLLINETHIIGLYYLKFKIILLIFF